MKGGGGRKGEEEGTEGEGGRSGEEEEQVEDEGSEGRGGRKREISGGGEEKVNRAQKDSRRPWSLNSTRTNLGGIDCSWVGRALEECHVELRRDVCHGWYLVRSRPASFHVAVLSDLDLLYCQHPHTLQGTI